MDFVAAIEDEFDIIITMNLQAEIETYGQLVDAVVKLHELRQGMTDLIGEESRGQAGRPAFASSTR